MEGSTQLREGDSEIESNSKKTFGDGNPLLNHLQLSEEVKQRTEERFSREEPAEEGRRVCEETKTWKEQSAV